MHTFPELPAFLDRTNPDCAFKSEKILFMDELPVSKFTAKQMFQTRGKYVVDTLPPLPGAKPVKAAIKKRAKPRGAKPGRNAKVRKAKYS